MEECLSECRWRGMNPKREKEDRRDHQCIGWGASAKVSAEKGQAT